MKPQSKVLDITVRPLREADRDQVREVLADLRDNLGEVVVPAAVGMQQIGRASCRERV